MKHFTDFGSIFDETQPSAPARRTKSPAEKVRSMNKRLKWEAAYQKRAEWPLEEFENEDQRLRAEVEVILSERQKQ